jgi:hypothetical protein
MVCPVDDINPMGGSFFQGGMRVRRENRVEGKYYWMDKR